MLGVLAAHLAPAQQPQQEEATRDGDEEHQDVGAPGEPERRVLLITDAGEHAHGRGSSFAVRRDTWLKMVTSSRK